MKNQAKKFSPAIYGLALICFFLPFTRISCQGTTVATLTGIQLITGAEIEQPGMPKMFGPSIGPSMPEKEVEKTEPELLAVLVFLTIIVGLGLSFLKGRLAPAITGFIGLIFLLALKAKIDNEALKEGGGMLQVEYGAGFWFVFLLLLAAIGLNIFLFSQRKKKIEQQ